MACVLTSRSDGHFSPHGDPSSRADALPAEEATSEPLLTAAELGDEEPRVSSCDADASLPSLTTDEVRERVLAAARPFTGSWSPILPADWPPASGQLLVAGFDYEALSSDVVSYRVRGPRRQVRVGATDGASSLERERRVRSLGVAREPFLSGAQQGDLRDAEAALVDLVAGRTCFEDVLPILRGYCAYVALGGPEAGWATERVPAFFEAMACPPTGP